MEGGAGLCWPDMGDLSGSVQHMPLLDPYEGLYGTDIESTFTDLSVYDTLLEGMPTLPGSTGDTAHVWKPNTPSPHAGMGHSMLTPAPPPAPCRVDQAAQQPAQCAPRRRVIVRLKVPNSLGTMQKPALAQPPPAAAPPHCSERLLPPKHVWGAKQPPQEHMPPRGDVRTSPHKRAWRLEQPGADVQPPRADEYLPLPTGGSPVQAPRNTERPRPPKRVRRDPPADACTEAAHAHAAGCVARPAKPCHAGGPAKVLVGGCWAAGSPSVQTEVVERAEAHRGQAAGTPRRRALDETGCGEHARDPAKTVTGCAAARSRGVTSQYLCHTEPHATIAHATGVPRKLSADAMRACSPHCGARDDTVCGASESFVAGASSAPSAKRARTGAGFAGGGCGAGGAWDAAQVPQMRAANVGTRRAARRYNGLPGWGGQAGRSLRLPALALSAAHLRFAAPR